jgi:hypothetical protein
MAPWVPECRLSAGGKMMVAISRNFDLDQSSNVLARTTYEFPLIMRQFALWAKRGPISPSRRLM